MRHVFILNPVSGKHAPAMCLKPEIEAYFAQHGGDYAVRVTEYAGHAREIAREEAEKGDGVRLYACGGDGTLFEVVNGMFGYPNAQLALMPCGSGNDYVKTYGEKQAFLDLSAQMEGQVIEADAIRAGEHISINIGCMGLDANVAAQMIRYKRLPLVSGRMAYHLSVVQNFLGKIGARFTVYIDGKEMASGRLLFALAACGRFYGGSYMGAPNADPTDGLLDITLVKTLSRAKVPFIIRHYKSGEHEKIASYAAHYTGRSLRLKADQPLPVSVDGEIFFSDDITFESLPHSVPFVVPKGVLPGWMKQTNQSDKEQTVCL